MAEETRQLEQVVQKINPLYRLLRTWRLQGGVSAQVTALEVLQPDGYTKKMIVRRHGEIDRKQNAQIAADEFKLLQYLHSVGMAVPTPYLLDQSGEIFPIPYIVIEYIEGSTESASTRISDLMLQLAKQLARIHQIDCAHLSFLPLQEKRYTERLRKRPAAVDETLHEGRIRTTLEAVWPLTSQNSVALLHGDYWPGNIVWRNGQLAGVIDWEDAALGDPLADLANSRLELLWASGIEAMQYFTDHYRSMTSVDFTQLPYWDLCVALRPIGQISQWGLDAGIERSMREKHRWFTAQAFSLLNDL